MALKGYNLNGIDIPVFPADPLETAVNGRIYFNSASKLVRIYKDGAWGNLVIAGSGTVTSVATGTGLTGGPVITTGTIALANTTVTAGSYGSQFVVPSITVDAQGRLTAASNNTAISTSTLGAVPTSRTITAGTGLSGGGDLSANRTVSLADTAVTPGAYTSANITVDAQGRLTAATSGSGSGANDTLSNLTSPTAINQDLNMAGTKTLILPNNVALRALDNTAAARDILFIDAFNRTTLAGVGAGNILFNNNMIPASPDTISIGVLGDGLLDIYTNTMQFSSSGATYGAVDFVSTTPTGVSTPVAMHTDSVSKNLAIFTANGTATKDVLIESGNASAGSSGNIALTTGTSTTDSTGNLNFNSGITSGSGFNSGAINFTSGAVTVGNGSSGTLNLVTGNSVDGSTGAVNFLTGTPSGTGPSGDITLITGNPSITGISGSSVIGTGQTINGNSGNAQLYTGLTDGNGSSGEIDINTGAANGTGNTGLISLFTGNAGANGDSGSLSLTTGSVGSGNGGSILLITGDAITGDTGGISLATGGVSDVGSVQPSGNLSFSTGSAAGSAPSGDITLTTGGASTRGAVTIDAIYLGCPRAAADPTGTSGGQVYYNTGSNKLKVFNGTTWETITSV